MPIAGAGAVIDGRYEILGVLGTGGFGTVYKAKQVHLDRIVALKVLNAGADAEVWARFEREAKILSSLQNKHITLFHNFGHWNGAPYMVMEFVEGRDLQKTLFSNKPLGEARSLKILTQICDAVAAAHAAGIVHRDLKPSNVLLAPDDFVKMIDFGLAKVLTGGPAQNLTEAGCAVGSILYMSPEQCLGQPVDERSDIYALGAIFYHCLTGHPPFAGDHSVVVMQKHISENPPRLVEASIKRERLSGLQAVLDKCLAKNSQHRYESVADLLADLQLIQANKKPGAYVQAGQVEREDVKPSDAAEKKRGWYRIPLVAAAVILVGLLGVGSCLWFTDARLLADIAGFWESNKMAGAAEVVRSHVFNDLTRARSPEWVEAGIALIRTEKANGNRDDAKAVYSEIEQYLLEGARRHDAGLVKELVTLRQVYCQDDDPAIGDAMYDYANLLLEAHRDSEARPALERYLQVVESSMKRDRRHEILARCRLIAILPKEEWAKAEAELWRLLNDCTGQTDLNEDDLDCVQSAVTIVSGRNYVISTRCFEKWLKDCQHICEQCHVSAKARVRYEIQTLASLGIRLIAHKSWKELDAQLNQILQLCESSHLLSNGAHPELRYHIKYVVGLFAKLNPSASDAERVAYAFLGSTDRAMQICGLGGMAVLNKRLQKFKEAEIYHARELALSAELDGRSKSRLLR